MQVYIQCCVGAMANVHTHSKALLSALSLFKNGICISFSRK